MYTHHSTDQPESQTSAEGLSLARTLPIDLDAARKQLLLLGYAPDEPIYLRSLPAKGLPQGTAPAPVKFQRKLDTLPTHCGADSALYLVVNGGGHIDADVKQCRALFLEFDDRSFDEQIATIRQRCNAIGLPEPSFAIRTRKSLHCYWPLSEPLESTEWRSLQTRLIHHFGSDPAVKNPSRLMRLAGAWHTIYGQEPIRCDFDSAFTGGGTVNAELFDQLLPAVAPPKASVAPRATQEGLTSEGEMSQKDVQYYLNQIDPDISYPDWFKVCSAIHAALGDDGFDVFHTWSQKGSKYKDESECSQKWNDYEPGRVTARTLVFLAHDPERIAAEKQVAEFRAAWDLDLSDELGYPSPPPPKAIAPAVEPAAIPADSAAENIKAKETPTRDSGANDPDFLKWLDEQEAYSSPVSDEEWAEIQAGPSTAPPAETSAELHLDPSTPSPEASPENRKAKEISADEPKPSDRPKKSAFERLFGYAPAEAKPLDSEYLKWIDEQEAGCHQMSDEEWAESQAAHLKSKKQKDASGLCSDGYPSVGQRHGAERLKLWSDEFYDLDGQRHEPGLYLHTATKPDDKNKRKPVDILISAPFRVAGIGYRPAEIPGTYSHDILFQFERRGVSGDRTAELWFPCSDIYSTGEKALYRALLGAGLSKMQDMHLVERQRALSSYVAQQIDSGSIPEIKFAAAPGWVELPGDRDAFLIDAQRVAYSHGHDQRLALMLDPLKAGSVNLYSTAGTLEGQLEWVTELVSLGTVPAFTVALSLVGPLLKPLPVSMNPSFHLQGSSGTGKTTLLKVAAATWGGPDRFLLSFDSTIAGLESAAMLRNHSLIGLDELGSIGKPEQLQQFLYLLANGRGRGRSSKTLAARTTAEFRAPILSSGELGMTDAAATATRGTGTLNAGAQFRSIALSCNRAYGVLDRLPQAGYGNHKDLFAQWLSGVMAKHHGHLGFAFAKALLSNPGLKTDLKQCQADVRARLSDAIGLQPSESQAARSIESFVLVGVVAEQLAVHNLLPEAATKAMSKAVEVLASEWLAQHRADFGEGGEDVEKRLAYDALMNFYEKNAAAFTDRLVRPNHVPSTHWGYHGKENGFEYIYLSAGAIRECFKGQDLRASLKRLQDDEIFIPGEPKRDGQTQLWAYRPGSHALSRCWLYVFQLKVDDAEAGPLSIDPETRPNELPVPLEGTDFSAV